MTLSELFKDLTEDKHCKGCLALDENGFACNEKSPDAKRWCALGWIWKLSSKDKFYKLDELSKYANSLGYDEMSKANDEMGYAFIKSIQENCK